eukprot:GEMP01071753.1.p1 GENE.GEMP01071753.1~~GEMP01071753.1.p1  ORF type:complete len:306 (+),score=96.08 GEMP01071753.1:80-997(+)
MAAPPSRRRGALPPMKKNRAGIGLVRVGGAMAREMGARAPPSADPNAHAASNSNSPGAPKVPEATTPRTDRLIRAANFALPPNQQLLVSIIDKLAQLSMNVRRLNEQVARLGAQNDDYGQKFDKLRMDVDLSVKQEEELNNIKKSAIQAKVASQWSDAAKSHKEQMDRTNTTQEIEALQKEMERLREDAQQPREDDEENWRAVAAREEIHRQELMRRLEETETEQRNTREIVDKRLQQSDVDHKELLAVAHEEVNLLSALRLSVEAFEKDVVRQNEHLERLTSRLNDLESSHNTVAGKLAYLLHT